jgi:hypothetical protein
MRNSEQQQTEEIDLTKTLLFILLSLVLTLMIASMMIIPDIQQLKISKIHTERSLKMLKDTRGYYDQLSEENSQLQEKNRKVIEALQVAFKKERMQQFGEEKMGRFDIQGSKLVPHDQNFIRYELNATTRIDSPVRLYDFINALNGYESLAEMDFPIVIDADKEYNLDMKLRLNIYELSSK